MVDVLERRAFVGRGRELARLLELFDAAERGEGRTAIIAGEAGIGKSRLVAQLAASVGDRAQALAGACPADAGFGVPYAPFVEILRELLAGVPEAAVPALAGPGRGLLRRLLPELAGREADVPSTMDADATSQVRLFEVYLGVLRRRSQARPLILVVEDVQWADRSTRQLLAYIVRGLSDARVLIAVTLRSPEDGLDDASRAFVVELERDDGVVRIDLRPLDRVDVADQAAALLGDRPAAATIDRLWRRCDGNPFFVEELVLAGSAERDDLPVVVRDVLDDRLAGLSAAARDVLRAAAIDGRAIDDGLLGEVLGMDGRHLAAALREALAAGVLARASDGRVAFRHALLREAVQRELFPTERTALHRAFAEALERRGAGGRQPVPAADLARHWDGAAEPGRALGPTFEAAKASEAVFAWPEALAAWERTRVLSREVPDAATVTGLSVAEVDGRAADCALLAGEDGRAIELGRAAIDAVDPAADPVLAGRLEDRLRWYLWEAGDRRGAALAVEAALRVLPEQPPSRDRTAALAQHAGILLFAGEPRASEAVAREAIRLARAGGWPGELALALGVLGWDVAALGEIDAGLAYFREGQAIANEIGSAEGSAVAALNLVALLDRVGRSQPELDAALDGYALTERLGLNRTFGGLLLGYAAKAQLLLGRWDDVDRTTAAALRTGASERAELWLSINRARLLVGRGAFADAGTLLQRARTLEARLGGTEFEGSLLLAEAELGAWTGDLEAVRRAAAAGVVAIRTGAAPDTSLAWLAILAFRAEADAAADRATTGRDGRGAEVGGGQLAEIDAAVEAVLADRPELGPGERSAAIRALLAAERGRLVGSASPADWRDVASRWATIGRPHPEAYARLREAEAILASRGEREAAATSLSRARELATALGAQPLVGRIDDLARAARLSVGSGAEQVPAGGRGPLAGDPYGFTPREREVLDLVAAGQTNQQIADRLFITRKTASVHVSNVMAKLGAEHRGEAAAMARRLGLVD